MSSRLEAYLATLEGKPFEWGSNDCRTMAQGWLEIVGGYDHVIEAGNAAMAECKTAKDFVRLMREQQMVISPAFIEEQLGGKAKIAYQCREGSVAVFPLPGNKGWRLGLVDADGAVAGLTEGGLVREKSQQALAVEIG